MDKLLGLPQDIKKPNVKMVFLGYKTITPTGRRKTQESKPYVEPEVVQHAFALGQATRMVSDQREPKTEQDDTLCYCFKCKKAVNAIIHENAVRNDLNYHAYIQRIYECPTCNQMVLDTNIFQLKTTYTVFRQYFLDDNKLKIKRKEYVFKWYNNHLFIEMYNHLTTLNLDTGYAYNFGVLKNGVNKHPHIVNSTYSLKNMDSNYGMYTDKCKEYCAFYDELYSVIRKYKMEHLNIFIPEFNSIKPDNNTSIMHLKTYNRRKNTPNQEQVIAFNRFPTMDPYYAVRHFYNSDRSKNFIKMRRSIKVDSLDPMRSILEHYNMPVTKMNKKRISKNLCYATYFNTLNDVIDNYDNVNKILNEEVLANTYDYEIDVIADTLKVIKDMKGFNINSFCNKVEKIDCEKYIMLDMLRLIRQVLTRKPEYKINFKLSFKELHDKLAKDYNKLQHENAVIEYDEVNHELEGNYGELTFNLAKDTYELIDVGTEMGICVGGYGHRAADKQLNILIARDAETKPVICIEIDEDYYKVKQTKLKYNNTIQQDTIEYKAIKEWIEKHYMFIETYRDIPEELKIAVNSGEKVILRGKQLEKLKVKSQKLKTNPFQEQPAMRPAQARYF